MTRSRLSIVVACLLILLLGCSDPDYVRDYPRITSSGIVHVTPAGVDVSMTIDAALFDKITDVGVVWDSTRDIDINEDFVLRLGKPASTSVKVEVRAELLAGQEYFIKVFAVGNGKTIYGLPLRFTSQGSEGPVIESISPTVVTPGDLVTITGKQFGTDPKTTKVGFRISTFETISASIKTITDREIVVYVPQFFAATANIVIEKAENDPVISATMITRRLPKFDRINTTDLCSGIEVTGEDFLILGKPTLLTVNGKAISPLPTINATNFVIGIANHAPQITVKLGYTGYEITQTFNDNSARPAVTNSSLPAQLPESREIILTGTNFPVCDGLSVVTEEDAGTTLQIIDVKATQVTVKATNVGCDAFKLKLLYNDQEVYFSNSISPPEFKITSLSPDHGIVGDKIKVIGTNMTGVAAEIGVDPTFFNFSFNLDQLVESTSTEATITLQPPRDLVSWYHSPDGKTTIMLDKCGIQFVYPFDYQLYEPILGDFSPKVSDGLQPIVITGMHFSSDPNVAVILLAPNGGRYHLVLTDVTDTQITTDGPRFHGALGKYRLLVRQWGVDYEFPQQIEIAF